MTPDQTGRLSRRTLLGMALGGATSLDNPLASSESVAWSGRIDARVTCHASAISRKPEER
jgi:hypothetical protein